MRWRLAAAATVFLRFGYRKTAMEDIARAAGMSRQGLYLHYATKEELFRAADQVIDSRRVAGFGRIEGPDTSEQVRSRSVERVSHAASSPRRSPLNVDDDVDNGSVQDCSAPYLVANEALIGWDRLGVLARSRDPNLTSIVIPVYKEVGTIGSATTLTLNTNWTVRAAAGGIGTRVFPRSAGCRVRSC
jgi:AcrR family transcriptional regulator